MSKMSRWQQTLKEVVQFSGIGLHTGKIINVTIRPAPPGSGILFVRSDLKKSPYIKASLDNVVDTNMATSIGKGGVVISTIEHLMAAFYAYEIDNAVVEVSGGEIPILDGSALGYTYLLSEAGVVEQNRLRKVLVVTKEFTFIDGDRSVTIRPANKFNVSCEIKFKHPVIKTQKKTFFLKIKDFETDIAPARTFGFVNEVQFLQKSGLALGGSLKNAVVLDDNNVMNEEGLRFVDEFVRHKILDLIGDFAVMGMPILGSVEVRKSGHQLHSRFISALLGNQDCFRVVTLGADKRRRTVPLAGGIPVKALPVWSS